jgi:hypothetical protein
MNKNKFNKRYDYSFLGFYNNTILDSTRKSITNGSVQRAYV